MNRTGPKEAIPDGENGLAAVRRYVTRAGWGKLSVYAICGVAAVVAIWLAGHDLVRHLDALERWIAGLGPWGQAAFVALFVIATSLFVPESVLSIAAGALFGMATGSAMVAVGILLASSLQYWLAHGLLRERIDRVARSRPALAAMRTAVLAQETKLQLLVRLAPLNPATVSYVLGAAGVGFGRFLLACVAMAPHLCIEVYLGFAGKHLALAAGAAKRSAPLHDLLMVAGLAAAIVIFWLISRIARKAFIEIERAAQRASADEPRASA